MSYQRERDQFIAQMAREGLETWRIVLLLRAATTLQRIAELECSSEAADRDRVDCPASPIHRFYTRIAGTAILKPHQVPRKVNGPCCCDYDHDAGEHRDVPRVTAQGARLEARVAEALTAAGKGWEMETAGDPRGAVLRVIPPSYQARNQGRDRHNRESIGVPARDTRLRF